MELVNPTAHGHVIQHLDVENSGCSITEGYYEGTRISAALSVPDWSGYDGYAWVRMTHGVEGTGYSQRLFTGFVWDEGATLTRGALSASPHCVSALKALDGDYTTHAVSVGRGGTAKAVAEQLLKGAARPLRFESGCPDHRFAESRVWDAGTSRLSLLNDLCDLMSARADVDPDGVVTLSRYVAPSQRAASRWIDGDAHGVVLSADISRSSEAHQTPSRVIVTWSGSEGGGDARHDVSISGYADLPARSAFAWQRRGYLLSDVRQMNDMGDPRNVSHAQQLARSYLPGESTGTEWDVSMLWLPVHEGDVVQFRPPGMDWRKCLCKSLDIDLNKWTIKATLKEVG